ncbi:unnamed protein product [Schistosoma turkestanicum]|nr:unnamed protein product [Schistosoma turkestanicum]
MEHSCALNIPSIIPRCIENELTLEHLSSSHKNSECNVELDEKKFIAESYLNNETSNMKCEILDSRARSGKLNIDNDDGDVEHDHREEWNNQFDFFLSILGYAVDLANVWRFPYVCFTNGGGAFLIPYFIVMICSATPMFYLELILGQKHRRGAVSLWDICPMFRGVGIAQVIISYIVAFYYNTISAWSLYFLFASISDILPWTYCDQRRGNSVNCVNFTYLHNLSSTISSVNDGNDLLQLKNYSLASIEYFERVVLKLQQSTGLEDLGPMRWQLAGCTILIFSILFASMRNGVKTSGKVWANAAIQIFFSTGAGFGAHIAYATYNPRRYNCYRDCLITSFVNALTSIFAGVTVFAYLGYLAHLTHTTVQTVTGEGPGLVFQVYPFAIGTLPLAPLWATIFFLLLIMLGLDSGMGGLESAVTALTDIVPKKYSRYKHLRPIITLAVIGSACSVAFVNVTSVMIVSSLTDPTPLQYNYGAKHPELSTNYSEVVNITLHGTSQFYIYPKWSIYLGWTMSGISISMIPLVFLIVLMKNGCRIKLQISEIFSMGPPDVWPLKKRHNILDRYFNRRRGIDKKYTDKIDEDKNIESDHFETAKQDNQIET